MATVTFPCGHCGKLMAVTSEHLGKRVRCPHCQQVIEARAPAAPAPAPPPPRPPQPAAPTVTTPPVAPPPPRPPQPAVPAPVAPAPAPPPPRPPQPAAPAPIVPTSVPPPQPVAASPSPWPPQPVAAPFSPPPVKPPEPAFHPAPPPLQPPGPAVNPLAVVPPELIFSSPPATYQESIFESMEDAGGDALFGGTTTPLVEMPPEPPLPNLQIEAAPAPPPMPSVPIEAAPPPPPPPSPEEPFLTPNLGPEAMVSYLTPEPPAPSSGSNLNFTSSPPADSAFAPAGAIHEIQEGPLPEPVPEPESEELATLTRPLAPRPSRGGTLVPTLLIFLIPYCIFSTVALVLLYLKKQQPSLEILPDPESDPKKGGPARRQRLSIDDRVPPKLLVKLGDTVKVGDLDVTPQKVELFSDHRLRLILTLKNRSDDLDFNPVSNGFLKTSPLPYTYLENDRGERVFGGEWFPNRNNQAFDGRLGPGEVMTAWLTTNPRDAKTVRKVTRADGTLLWRVQVRRGFIQRDGKDIATTAVIGVEFPFRQVEKKDRSEVAQLRTPSPA